MPDIVVIGERYRLSEGYGSFLGGGAAGDPDFANEPEFTPIGETGHGGIDPRLFSREAVTCPSGATCTPEPGSNGMFVKDTTTGIVYFSEQGYERALRGGDTDWAGVARDLLNIVGASLGGVAMGVIGIIGYYLTLGGFAIDCWFNDNC